MSELSIDGRRLLAAIAAVRAHAEVHKCDGCISNIGALFDAVGYWVNGAIMTEESDNGKTEAGKQDAEDDLASQWGK